MMSDILIMLMVAFGLFAIVMFILFYVYLRKYYNKRHMEEDYEKVGDDDNEPIDISSSIEKDTSNNVTEETPPVVENYDDSSDGEFMPIKKK